MVDQIRMRMVDQQRSELIGRGHWKQIGRWHRTRRHLLLWIGAQPITAAFWSLTLVFALSGVATILVGWPVLHADTDDYAGAVLAAASAIAFGSIVFSAVNASTSAAADIAPGYTQVVLGRGRLWFTGLGLVIASGMLFVAASFNPTRSGALAASFFAMALVGLSWTSARQAIAESDPLVVAQNASAHYRRITRRGRRNVAGNFRLGLSKEARAEPGLVRLRRSARNRRSSQDSCGSCTPASLAPFREED